MSNKQGFIYAATGDTYIREAIYSAHSYKKHMPDTPITLFADDISEAQNENCFDQCFTIPNPAFGPSDKFYALQRSPYENTVFVDTDTYCIDQCNELFRILERFEFAAAHAPVRAMNFVPKGVPRCFPEFNTGVMAFRNCESVKNLFADWDSCYTDFRQRKEIKRDQLSFRKVLYFSTVTLTVLPPEYNLRPMFSYFVGGFGPVKIVHARDKELEKALEIVSANNADMSIYPYVVSIPRS